MSGSANEAERPQNVVGSSGMGAPLTSIEICAGGGGQAIGLEHAGFEHLALVENDPHACETLRTNRPDWLVFGPHTSTPAKRRRESSGDVTTFDATPWRGRVALLAGGVPCPPFSKAGKQLGADDERDLFPAALDLVDDCEPRAVMLENVPGILSAKFDAYREQVEARLQARGYETFWDKVQSSDFGVPQLRPRAILVAIESGSASRFTWPDADDYAPAQTVGQALLDLMSERGWRGAERWAFEEATGIAPTLVGGSKKHGGPDLGPTRAKQQWARLGVNALGVADEPPAVHFDEMPKLTVEMTAVIQGFDPAEWRIHGRKTAAYRQVGNAFPPPVARAFGRRIKEALRPALTVAEGGRRQSPVRDADELLVASG